GYRIAFTEHFDGAPETHRAYLVSLPGAWGDGSFSEPLPHEHKGEFGADGAAGTSHHWLSNTDGVWRAPAAQPHLDVDERLLKLRVRLRPFEGSLEAHLDDHDGALSSAVQLALGAQVELRL